ncbi:MAG: hypothetical protein ABF726_11595, partial [Acetobacter sp.]
GLAAAGPAPAGASAGVGALGGAGWGVAGGGLGTGPPLLLWACSVAGWHRSRMASITPGRSNWCCTMART